MKEKSKIIRRIIRELPDVDGKGVPYSYILAMGKEEGIGKEIVDELLKQEKEEGRICEPAKGYYKLCDRKSRK